ncbi:MAG: hemolysin family protein [Armatimonadota bacterium]
MALDARDWTFIIISLVLLLLSAIFSAAEIGMLSANRFRIHQLAEDGSRRARLLERLLEQPSRLLTVILILITAINYTNESVVTYWLHNLLGLPEWIPFVSLLVLVLIFSEVTPISYAAANPETVATGLAPLVSLSTRIFQPVVTVFTGLSTLILRLLGREARQRPLVTGEEVMTIVEMETERGVLEQEERELIHSIFEFSDTVVREIMRPRIDIAAVDDAAPLHEAIDLLIDRHYSRLPVYQGSLDHIIGLVNAKDLLPYQIRGELDLPVRNVMRPVVFVPETKHISELLREMRESKQTLAVVLDEYGGTAGLVTVEDLLEEIVGEIYDEYDVVQAMIEWIDPHTVVVDGKLLIEEVEDLIDRELPHGDYDTIGGFLYSRFGDVPALGESFTANDLQFTAERLDGHRITKVRITLPAGDEGVKG